MKVLRAYKTELDPSKVQKSALMNHAGAARKAYTWGLGRKIEEYKRTGKSPSAIDLHKELVVLKNVPKEEGGFPWMREVSKCAPQEALRNLDKAYKNYFRRCKEGAKDKGFPQPKSRKKGVGSFTLTGSIRATDAHVQLPRLGELRLKEHGYLPVSGARILSATVSEKAGHWFVSLQVEQEVPDPLPLPVHVVGVDVGIKSLAVTSDGKVFENLKALKSAEDRLKVLQQKVSRRTKGSNNRRKAVLLVAIQHYKIACIRKDALHKASSAIAKSGSVIVLETLNVAGMMKNHKLARALSDSSLAELHRQIEYKVKWRGAELKRSERWYPSSRTSSGCGTVKDILSLSEREFVCDCGCGFRMDRDLNAAINLRNLFTKTTESSSGIACCPGSSGPRCETRTKLLVGQEPGADRGLAP